MAAIMPSTMMTFPNRAAGWRLCCLVLATFSAWTVELFVAQPAVTPDGGELLRALQRGDEALALELLNSSHALALLKRRSRRHDCTPLMLAAGASGCPASDAVVERILSFGPAANVAARSRSHRSAAQYAALHPTCAHWSPRLEALAAQELAATAAQRCPCCGQALARRPRIASLADRYHRGEHENQLIERFFEEEAEAKNSESQRPTAWKTLMQPEFHIFHRSRTFHKELSESLAILDEIQQSCPQILQDSDQWHFLDLCSGKSLTALLMSTRRPNLAVSALDRIGPEGIPHYKEAGLPVEYLQQDLLDATAESAVAASLEQAGRSKAVLAGLHLCGNLSVRAVELFRKYQSTQAKHGRALSEGNLLQLPSIRVCILVPCCLPHMRDAPKALKHLYRQSVADDAQYTAWVGYLEAQLEAPNVEIRKSAAVQMKSKKNMVLTAIKSDI